MNDITVLNGQSLFDIALENSGSTLSAFEYALKNGISVTDLLQTGQKIAKPISEFENISVLDFFLQKNIATELQEQLFEIEIGLGIGTMIIENNFTVS
jgi:hypothetical protein